jgi:RNA polymerase sigma-70 factor (ECF subfamily)
MTAWTQGEACVSRIERFEELRPLLLSIACRILRGGSEAEAEDMVHGCGVPEIAAALGCSEAVCRRLVATVCESREIREVHEDHEMHETRNRGGEALPWPTCIAGAEQVARVLAAIVPALARLGVSMRPHQVDEGPGVVFRDRNGQVLGALALDVLEEQIRTIRWVTNPDGCDGWAP